MDAQRDLGMMAALAADRASAANQGEVKMPNISLGSKTKQFAIRTRTFVVAGLAAILGACATEGVAPATDHRPVSIDILPAGSPCPAQWTCMAQGRFMVAVDEEPIKIRDEAHPVKIMWKIVPQAWSFIRDKGIDIKNGPPSQQESEKVYLAHFRSRDGVIYKYSINLTNGTDTVTWDPTIVN